MRLSELSHIWKRVAWVACVLLLGVSHQGFADAFFPWREPPPRDTQPTDSGTPAKSCPTCANSAENQKGPHTLPEAVHAYLDCLHSPPPPTADRKNDSRSGNGETDDKKENSKEKEEKDEKDAWYSAHAQTTVVTQEHNHFHSPYVGANSLLPNENSATSLTSTIFYAARLCEGTELVFNPELAGGTGFSGTRGLAGFSNGEITRVGVASPTPYIARLFLRQTWGLGEDTEKVKDEENQIAGTRPVDRITLTFGKFTPTDLFDDNRYSHDPRTQFLNWSLMYNGAWDYPANVRGYTYGLGTELNHKDWALRYAILMEPAVANGATLDSHILEAHGQAIEWESRYTINERPGKLRVLTYANRAHMGKYSDAIAAMPVNPDITQTRAYRVKYGFGINVEQEWTDDLGGFLRLGWNDGHSEAWAFTEIDETMAMGLLLKGRCWCRPNDTVGLALVCNGLSPDHRDYLAAGGLGFIIGDGKLNYGLEEILEFDYNLEIHKGINLTFNFEGVNHPAYNKDRGPVAIGGLRVHLEF